MLLSKKMLTIIKWLIQALQLYILNLGFSNFSRAGATFTPCYQLEGRKIINETICWKAIAVYKKKFYIPN